ncbi:MAG: phosphoglycerate mutase, 2,3-bisphosphoglycerate-dependent phosphoglycerate mutase [Candidatus Doudnabacteria bacterium]|nr:phosphoglycerate mutase, 2,3-bisphosphoglycerate-dependent phosphoglycerate mutase [Candidatus Doudnabacteria bacterium]
MSDNQTIIYIVRHGQTQMNTENRLQGRVDSPLTELGIKQAQALGEKFKEIGFDAIYSSPAGRARDTAKHLKLERALDVMVVDDLAERSFGSSEGITMEESMVLYKDKHEEYRVLNTEERTKFKFTEDSENDIEVAERFLKALKTIAEANYGKTLLIVSHGGTLRSVLARFDRNYYNRQMYQINNTAWAKISYDGDNFKLLEIDGVEKKNDN